MKRIALFLMLAGTLAAQERRLRVLFLTGEMDSYHDWRTGTALMRGSARHLAPGGVLVTYGPYLEDEVPTAPSNLAFDASLRQRNPAWGVRRREDLERTAAKAGLRLAERYVMPANNLTLVWRRA